MIEGNSNGGRERQKNDHLREQQLIRDTSSDNLPSGGEEKKVSSLPFGSKEKPATHEIFSSKEQPPLSDIPEKGSLFRRFIEKITKQDPKEEKKEPKPCIIELSEEAPPVLEEVTCRLKGELEQGDPTIEPLPPTPIADEARERLASWGVPEEALTRLQELTSSFRYDLTPQKAERIAREGGYIQKNEEGKDEIVLPNVLNFDDRGDGQCADLAEQWIKSLYTSGYMSELNAKLQNEGKEPLNPMLFAGKSRTHFVSEAEHVNHVWPGLLPMGESIKDVVVVDPSFQEISNIDTNGYVAKRIIQPTTLEQSGTSLKLAVGKYTENERSYETDITSTMLLGSSADRQLAYEVAFVRGNDDVIRPHVSSLLPEGRTGMSALVNHNNEVIFSEYMGSIPDGSFFTEDHKKEMESIVNALKGIKFERR